MIKRGPKAWHCGLRTAGWPAQAGCDKTNQRSFGGIENHEVETNPMEPAALEANR